MPRNLKIEVRLRSASKATRNDPRPTPSPGYYIRLMNGGLPDDTPDEMADSSSDDMSFASRSSEDDIFAEFEWLEQIDGLIFNQDDSDSGEIQVGYCDGKLIRREDIRAKFWFAMEQPTEETSSLAFDLFDRYGRLKPEFKVHPIKKGSGIWNTELDEGVIFLIESLRINGQYRRLGQGSTLVRAMLEKVRGKTLGFVTVVRPGVLCSELLCEPSGEEVPSNESLELAAREISKSFWRSLGFRRIGSSSWFGLASDPEHPCYRLAAESDYEIQTLSSSMLDTELERKMKIALEPSSENDFVNFLSQFWGDAAEDDERWTSADVNGNTILHLAATSTKPNSIQWILRRTKVLIHQRNTHGETPLDALLGSLENGRTIRRFNALTEDISDQFSGFSHTAVDCLIFLDGRTEVTDIDRQRLRYGCTCGQCISGFLSLRMCFALECQADIWSDFLREDLEDGNSWVENNNTFLSFLPRSVQNNLKTNKSMRNGVMNLCNHIANCLRGQMIPNESNVEMVLRDASEWPPTSRSFLQRGGSVGAVATMLFQRAMESDELAGDPLHTETFGKQIQQLSECRNDHEYGFVSGMCGYERVSPF